MRKIKLFLTALAALMTSVAFAQNITVTGRVTDSNTNEPVPFAGVYVEGTTLKLHANSCTSDDIYYITVEYTK